MPTGISIPTDAGAGFNLKPPAWPPKDLSLENGMPKGIPEQIQRALAVAASGYTNHTKAFTSPLALAPLAA